MNRWRWLRYTVGLGIAFAKGSIEPLYTDAKSISASIEFNGDTAISRGVLKPKLSTDTVEASIYVYLQRNENGAWITIATWNNASTNSLAIAGGSKAVASGYYYRTYAVGRVSTSEGVLLEQATKISVSVWH